MVDRLWNRVEGFHMVDMSWEVEIESTRKQLVRAAHTKVSVALMNARWKA